MRKPSADCGANSRLASLTNEIAGVKLVYDEWYHAGTNPVRDADTPMRTLYNSRRLLSIMAAMSNINETIRLGSEKSAPWPAILFQRQQGKVVRRLAARHAGAVALRHAMLACARAHAQALYTLTR